MSLDIDAIQASTNILAGLRDTRAQTQASLDQARADAAGAQARIDAFTASLDSLHEQVREQKAAIQILVADDAS